VYEDSGAFHHITDSITLEVIAITKTLSLCETHAYTNVCILNDSMSMLRKIEACWKRQKWLESVRRSILMGIDFICVPAMMV
jgi:ribonuclease HI